MPTAESNIYLYDGSFAGLFTAIFEAWRDKNFGDICAHENLRPGFFDRNIYIETDEKKAERISFWLETQVSESVRNDIYEYFAAEAPARERIIYFYLHACNRYGSAVDNYLTDPAVRDFIYAQKPIGRERNKILSFVRFKELEGNVLFSEISPEYNHLTYLGAFFFDRLTALPWMIYDSGRHMAAVSSGTRWTVVDQIVAESLKEKPDQADFEMLWKNYLQALNIKERENRKLQRQMLPMKYRKHMTEFQ